MCKIDETRSYTHNAFKAIVRRENLDKNDYLKYIDYEYAYEVREDKKIALRYFYYNKNYSSLYHPDSVPSSGQLRRPSDIILNILAKYNLDFENLYEMYKFYLKGDNELEFYAQKTECNLSDLLIDIKNFKKQLVKVRGELDEV